MRDAGKNRQKSAEGIVVRKSDEGLNMKYGSRTNNRPRCEPMKQKRTQVRPAQAKADGICRELLRVRRRVRRLVGERNRKRCG